MADSVVTVTLISDNERKVVTVPYNEETTAEDVCIYICKQESIGTLARHIFGLRITGRSNFLMPSATFNEKNRNVEFRVRCKVASTSKLSEVDSNAYDYYFRQARCDVLENKVPDIINEKYSRELFGLGIVDMYRVMLEKGIKRECIVKDYKKYIPKEVLKRHAFFVKKPILDMLGQLETRRYGPDYIKDKYLTQLDLIAPEYLAETYKAVTDQNGSTRNVIIKVSPYHPTESGLRYCYENQKEIWHVICTIEELGFISIRSEDGTVEISRKNGIPFYLKFNSTSSMLSFISLLDGYYRLTCKWTFNICKEVVTPSLKKLYLMKCHGPVGGEFAHWKLQAKKNNRHGCFLIRESETKYNHYYVDVCTKENSGNPQWFKLEKITENEFIFNDDLTRYTSIYQLMEAYKDPNGPIYLQECLPPSEYDISPLLLCRADNLEGDSLTDCSSATVHIPTSPVCISCKDLQVYKGQGKEGFRKLTTVYKSMWKLTKGKKIEVAMKMLNEEQYIKEYLNVAGQWAFIKSPAIVKLYGIAFTSNISLVMEYFKLGPLDQYLKNNKNLMKNEDLIEAASNLASALWHLKENNIVHGRIRCRKLMVNSHTENSFTVKLTDPGIHTDYSSSEVHWIPVECYSNLFFAKRSTAADVWAFATTLWEIFTLAEEVKPSDHTKAMLFYKSGKRQRKPNRCLIEIYMLMQECWHGDPQRRKEPQAIMRDLNQILYQVYNSRRVHSYAKPNSSCSIYSTSSIDTESTAVVTSDNLVEVNEMEEELSSSTYDFSLDPKQWDLPSNTYSYSDDEGPPITASTSLTSIQSVFELDGEYRVVLQGRIGQISYESISSLGRFLQEDLNVALKGITEGGFYGEVYKGTMESYSGENTTPRQVAVKKLKANALSSCLDDFEREIKIMKNLQHDNIVKILGVLREGEISLVMEYVQHGALFSYLRINRESLHTKQLLKYALDIAKGMEYLKQKKIVHRDLAARNILVVDENHVKISDFGLAQFIGPNDYYILKTTNRELPIKWYAPESLSDGKFSARSDVWSYGVTMCEMFNYGEEPNLTNLSEKEGQEQQVLLDALNKGARFPCPQHCPQAVYIRIIYPCWKWDPHARPSFLELIEVIQELLTQY